MTILFKIKCNNCGTIDDEGSPGWIWFNNMPGSFGALPVRINVNNKAIETNGYKEHWCSIKCFVEWLENYHKKIIQPPL